MNKLKISEIFYSLQGEGKYVGQPSVFLRLFGCNLKCEGFGMPAGEKSQQRFDIRFDDISQYKSINELPLVTTGCDSYASWDSRFKHLSPTYTIDETVDLLLEQINEQTWNQNVHLVITGGEPLLPGWQKIFPILLEHPKLVNLTNVTFETNGTKELSDDMKKWVIKTRKHVTFSVSPKLSASGEPAEKAIKPDSIASYIIGADPDVYTKFVCATEDHILEAMDVHAQFVDHLEKVYGGAKAVLPLYIMPAGGTTHQYNTTSKLIAELCMKYKLPYTPRLHIDLFGNAWAT